MHNDWRAFLESRGAMIGDDGARFALAPPGTEPDCALVDLSGLGVLAVRGADAAEFLQGQLSNDIRALSDTHSQLSSHCSPKGRMLAAFRVLRAGDAILLVLPRAQVAMLKKRLALFVLRAKVTIEDASDALVAIGLVGDCAEGALKAAFGTLPSTDNGITQAGGASLIRVPGAAARWLFLGPADQAQALWQQAMAASPPAVEADPDLWALHDIRAGLPTVLPETSDAFVPQMANMQLIDGVSFNKGCYCGQEVVARMQYLGKLKRRMYVGEVESPTPPRPGDALDAPGSHSEQGAGRIVDARPIGPGRYALLAVVEIAAAEAGDVRLGPDGPPVTLTAPPYGFPAEV